ncbi:MAG: toxin-activating lysine-acyltransferase [Hyphomicrobiaceae bacterium]|nr:toxin-activating lysine-acyltransferase [Hyphomicrobiaceae bacterium]
MSDDSPLFSAEDVASIIGPDRAAITSGQLPDPYRALGLAVSLMMTEPSLARLGFGHWTRALAGMINRRQYVFASADGKPSGFAGWGLTDEVTAERWLAGTAEPTYEQCCSGDCVVIFVWLARSAAINRHLLGHMRTLGPGRRLIYFKRFYPDGRMRRMRLAVSDAVVAHAGKAR